MTRPELFDRLIHLAQSDWERLSQVNLPRPARDALAGIEGKQPQIIALLNHYDAYPRSLEDLDQLVAGFLRTLEPPSDEASRPPAPPRPQPTRPDGGDQFRTSATSGPYGGRTGLPAPARGPDAPTRLLEARDREYVLEPLQPLLMVVYQDCLRLQDLLASARSIQEFTTFLFRVRGRTEDVEVRQAYGLVLERFVTCFERTAQQKPVAVSAWTVR